MSEALLRELLDREAIKETKARYYRFLDAHHWEGLRSVFTDDLTFRITHLDPIEGISRSGAIE